MGSTDPTVRPPRAVHGHDGCRPPPTMCAADIGRGRRRAGRGRIRCSPHGVRRMSCEAAPASWKRRKRRPSAATEACARAPSPAWHDRERRRAARPIPFDVPRPGDGAVVEHGALDGGCGPRLTAAVVTHETGTVGVRQQHVVVLGEKPRWCRRVGIGPRRVGQVEQLAASLVEEHPQARPEPFDHLAHPGQARPGRHVGDGRRPERAEVAENHRRRSRAR